MSKRPLASKPQYEATDMIVTMKHGIIQSNGDPVNCSQCQSTSVASEKMEWVGGTTHLEYQCMDCGIKVKTVLFERRSPPMFQIYI